MTVLQNLVGLSTRIGYKSFHTGIPSGSTDMMAELQSKLASRRVIKKDSDGGLNEEEDLFSSTHGDCEICLKYFSYKPVPLL